MKKVILSVIATIALFSQISFAKNGTTVSGPVTITVMGKNTGTSTTSNPDGSSTTNIGCDNFFEGVCYTITTGAAPCNPNNYNNPYVYLNVFGEESGLNLCGFLTGFEISSDETESLVKLSK